jgi:virulence-associated protein VagC
MLDERPVSLFRNGRNQAVRIPREFQRVSGLQVEDWLGAEA